MVDTQHLTLLTYFSSQIPVQWYEMTTDGSKVLGLNVLCTLHKISTLILFSYFFFGTAQMAKWSHFNSQLFWQWKFRSNQNMFYFFPVGYSYVQSKFYQTKQNKQTKRKYIIYLLTYIVQISALKEENTILLLPAFIKTVFRMISRKRFISK